MREPIIVTCRSDYQRASTLPLIIQIQTIAYSLKKIIANQQSKLVGREQRIAVLEEYIRLQRHHQFGASSEKSPGQAELFDAAELLGEEDAVRTADTGRFSGPADWQRPR